jgi:hypothetical protein
MPSEVRASYGMSRNAMALSEGEALHPAEGLEIGLCGTRDELNSAVATDTRLAPDGRRDDLAPT